MNTRPQYRFDDPCVDVYYSRRFGETIVGGRRRSSDHRSLPPNRWVRFEHWPDDETLGEAIWDAMGDIDDADPRDQETVLERDEVFAYSSSRGTNDYDEFEAFSWFFVVWRSPRGGNLWIVGTPRHADLGDLDADRVLAADTQPAQAAAALRGLKDDAVSHLIATFGPDAPWPPR